MIKIAHPAVAMFLANVVSIPPDMPPVERKAKIQEFILSAQMQVEDNDFTYGRNKNAV